MRLCVQELCQLGLGSGQGIGPFSGCIGYASWGKQTNKGCCLRIQSCRVGTGHAGTILSPCTGIAGRFLSTFGLSLKSAPMCPCTMASLAGSCMVNFKISSLVGCMFQIALHISLTVKLEGLDFVWLTRLTCRTSQVSAFCGVWSSRYHDV